MRPSLVLLLTACTASSGGTPRDDTVSTAQVRESMMQADRDFASDFATRRIDAWVSWFDTAGVQVEPGGTLPRGHDQIRTHMTTTFGDTARILAWRPTTADMSNDGTLGYTIGTYDYHVRGRDSAATASTGHYLTVWRRQADGSWKVLADIGTQHPKKQ